MLKYLLQMTFLLIAVFGGVALKSQGASIWVLALFVLAMACVSYFAFKRMT